MVEWRKNTFKYNGEYVYDFEIISYKDDTGYELIRDILYWAEEHFGYHYTRHLYYYHFSKTFRLFNSIDATIFALRWC